MTTLPARVALCSWAVAAVAAFAACSTTSPAVKPIDGLCALGFDADPSELVIVSPAPECPAHACLKVPLTNPNPPNGVMYPGPSEGLCTAGCQQDADCAADTTCISGFTCGVPEDLTVGPSCCEKICVCKDYVVVPESGVLATPPACDPSVASNTCCNLTGRAGNAMYPACPAG